MGFGKQHRDTLTCVMHFVLVCAKAWISQPAGQATGIAVPAMYNDISCNKACPKRQCCFLFCHASLSCHPAVVSDMSHTSRFVHKHAYTHKVHNESYHTSTNKQVRGASSCRQSSALIAAVADTRRQQGRCTDNPALLYSRGHDSISMPLICVSYLLL